ncbi:sugar-binding protein [Isosphaeraceae bacterium EP7]
MSNRTLFRGFTLLLGLVACLGSVGGKVAVADEPPLGKGVRGLVTRAKKPIAVDGKLDEWSHAFCTPVHYNHGKLNDRAAQFYYAWDEGSLYIGLRSLDRRPIDIGEPGSLWNGDAVEFYLDTRTGEKFRSKDWSEGAIHFFFSAFEGTKVKPRWEMRKGIATSDVVLEGVEIAAKGNPDGYELELKIPWINFPGFTPKAGSLIALDAELCSADGAGRVDRTFAFGSPLSVQQPASQATMQLVDVFDPDYFTQAGPASFPCWVETPWVQAERAEVVGVVAIPPTFVPYVGSVEFRLHDSSGHIVKTVPATIEPFGPEKWEFVRAVAKWPVDEFVPGAYFASARVLAKTGKPLATVTPRMIQEAAMTGR